MAINPNFVFTDSVPAQQAVQMAQIAALADAERRRINASQSIARENAAEQRAYTQAQMNQQDKALAQNERNSARQADLLREDLRLRRDVDTAKRNEIVADTRFNTIQSAIESDDPPTELELENMFSRFPELKPADMDLLRQTRLSRVTQLSQAADIGDQIAKKWNTDLANTDPNDPIKRDGIISAAQKQHGRFIIFDPESNSFVSLFRRPRVDQRIEPETGAPMNVGVPDSNESIGDILARSGIQGGGIPSSPIQAAMMALNRIPAPDVSSIGGIAGRIASPIASRMAGKYIGGRLNDWIKRLIGQGVNDDGTIATPPPAPMILPESDPYYFDRRQTYNY